MNGRIFNWPTIWLWAALLLAPALAMAQGPTDGAVTAGPAPEVEDPWRLRFDLSWVNPSGSSVFVNTGGSALGIDFNTGFGAGLRAEYLFSPRYGVEFGLLGAGNVDIASGVFGGAAASDLDVSGFAPLTVGLNVHLTPDSPVDVYLGPLLALVNYSSVDVRSIFGVAVTGVSIDNDVGWGAIAGFDVPVGKGGWLLHANLRYIDTDMKDSGGLVSFDSEFDPVIFSLGFGYRF